MSQLTYRVTVLFTVDASDADEIADRLGALRKVGEVIKVQANKKAGSQE